MMFRYAPWMALCFLPVGPALAVSVDETSLPGVVLLHVGEADNTGDVIGTIEGLLDDNRRLVVFGAPSELTRVRPDVANVWPATNTVVLDPMAGLGINGFDAPGDEARLQAIKLWPWASDARVGGTREPRVPRPDASFHQVDFSVSAGSPAQICRNFSDGMASEVFGDRRPDADSLRAFRREVRRWCQYGNLSFYAADGAHFTIEPFRGSPVPMLSLLTDWALIRSEDRADPGLTNYLFWTKMVGEGAGSGFTRRSRDGAWYDAVRKEVRNIMDAAIHSGWGPIEPRDVVTAWPLNSTFPLTGDNHLFRCDGVPAFRPPDCPLSPRLLKLFPQDSFDGKVTVSTNESLAFGGEAKVGRSFGARRTTSMTFGLHAARTVGRTAQVDMAMTRVRSNGGTAFSRSTWWTPDIPALFRWLEARGRVGDLGGTTPLAATLNPRHEILWELPLEGNAGRTFPYNVVYEAGLNTCADDYKCVSFGTALDLRSKARVGWSDVLRVHLPTH